MKNLTSPAQADEDGREAHAHWTFLSNHSHVLICLDRDPHMRLRDVAEQVGITERAVQRIVLELEQADVLTRQREGRRNVYEVHHDRPLRHPVEGHRSVGDLLEMVNAGLEAAQPTHDR